LHVATTKTGALRSCSQASSRPKTRLERPASASPPGCHLLGHPQRIVEILLRLADVLVASPVIAATLLSPFSGCWLS